MKRTPTRDQKMVDYIKEISQISYGNSNKKYKSLKLPFEVEVRKDVNWSKLAYELTYIKGKENALKVFSYFMSYLFPTGDITYEKYKSAMSEEVMRSNLIESLIIDILINNIK